MRFAGFVRFIFLTGLGVRRGREVEHCRDANRGRPMPIIIDCVRCRRRLESRDEWAGRQVKCPGCGETLTILPPAVALKARGTPPAATPVELPQARPAGYSAAPPGHARPRDGLTDLLEGAATASAPAIRRSAAKSASGAKGRRKSNSKATALIWLGSSVGFLVVCGGLGLAFLIPFVRGFRTAAARAEADRAAKRLSPLANPTAVPAVGEEPAAASGSIWTPNDQLLNQLPVNAAFDRYSMRLPTGFTPTLSGQKIILKEGAGRAWFWNSPLRESGPRQALVVMLAEYPTAPKGGISELEKTVRELASSWSKTAANSRQLGGRSETGQLAGKLFVRFRFQRLIGHETMFCTALGAFDGNRVLTILTLSPDRPETLDYQLLDAATLTFTQP